MKKKLLVLIAMVLMLVGCKSEKFYLDDEHYDKVGIVEIDNKELKKKEKNEDNFGIFVHNNEKVADFQYFVVSYFAQHQETNTKFGTCKNQK